MAWGRCAAVLLLAVLAGSARGYESDPYHRRLEPLADATPALNARVNDALARIVARRHPPADELAVVNRVFFALGGLHWVDRIERWAMRTPEIERIETPRAASIYAGHPLWATRVTALFGVGPTLSLAGHRVGTDKLGHFFSQGRKFWLRWRAHGDEARAAARSAYTERAIFGQLTTGDYSNADLVANYEGHRFYRSLFEDGIVPGKPAILRRQGGRWVQQRPFDWADHVNAYWDEALHVNHYDRWLEPRIRARLQERCTDYHRNPAAWTLDPTEDARLAARYAFLSLRDTRDLRLPRLCDAQPPGAIAR